MLRLGCCLSPLSKFLTTRLTTSKAVVGKTMEQQHTCFVLRPQSNCSTLQECFICAWAREKLNINITKSKKLFTEIYHVAVCLLDALTHKLRRLLPALLFIFTEVYPGFRKCLQAIFRPRLVSSWVLQGFGIVSIEKPKFCRSCLVFLAAVRASLLQLLLSVNRPATRQ